MPGFRSDVSFGCASTGRLHGIRPSHAEMTSRQGASCPLGMGGTELAHDQERGRAGLTPAGASFARPGFPGFSSSSSICRPRFAQAISLHFVHCEGRVDQLHHECCLSGCFVLTRRCHEQHGRAGNGRQRDRFAVLSGWSKLGGAGRFGSRGRQRPRCRFEPVGPCRECTGTEFEANNRANNIPRATLSGARPDREWFQVTDSPRNPGGNSHRDVLNSHRRRFPHMGSIPPSTVTL